MDDIVSNARDFHAQMEIEKGPGNKYVDGFHAAIDFIDILACLSKEGKFEPIVLKFKDKSLEE